MDIYNHWAASHYEGITRHTHIVTIDVTIGQHEWGVVLVEGLPRDGTDESRLRAVSEGKLARQAVQVLTADGTLGVLAEVVFLVTLSVVGVKDDLCFI